MQYISKSSMSSKFVTFLVASLSINLATQSNNNIWAAPIESEQKKTSELIIGQNQLPIPEQAQDSVPQEAQDVLGDFDYEDPEFWQNLCSQLEEQGKLAEAGQACERALELDPEQKNENADLWLDRGIALFNEGKYTEALPFFNKSLEIDSTYSLALTYRCANYYQLGQYEEAISDCEQALEINADWRDGSPLLAWYYKGVTFSRSGRLEEALNAYERGISHTPEDNLTNAERCRTLLELSYSQKAYKPCSEEKTVAFYERGLAPNPNNIITRTNQGLYFDELDRNKKALSAYDRVLKLQPDSSLVLSRRCEILNRTNSYQEALSACQQAIEGDGVWSTTSPAEVWNQSSRSQIGLKQYQEALNSAERAIALQNDLAEAWNNKGVSLWYLKQYKEAEIATKKAIEIEPKYTQGWFNYGRILSSLKQYREAISVYDLALSEKVNNVDRFVRADIWVNKGVAFWQLNQCQEALNSTQNAVALNPKSFEGWYNQGIAFACLGNFEQALAAYEEADDIKPENTAVLTSKGLALEKLGRYQDALSVLEEALSLNSDYVPAQQNRDRLLSQVNQNNQ
jgi:tetratricopeptide (TPR) repeat protein